MVTALHRKLLRDLVRLREQAIAIAVVMACGIAMFVMSVSMMGSLQDAIDTYYDGHRFAHVFAHARRAPRTLTHRLERIPGVARIEPRIVEGVLLDMPGMLEPASARIVSLPNASTSGMNTVHLRTGRLPEGRDGREVLVSQRFADAHDLVPGDTVTAILNGRREPLRVVGVALSPEFVYLLPPGGLLPEHDRYAVFWIGQEELEAAFDMEAAFNDLLIRVTPGASVDEIIDRVDALLSRYGGLGAYTRANQTSHQFLANEIEELRGTTLIAPLIFLAVAAFLLNIVIARLIATQREQIAALRALGYSAPEIARHYLAFAIAISSIAAVMGVVFGGWLGHGLTAMYASFFDFPEFDYRLGLRVIVTGLAIGPVAGTLAVLGALRSAIRLQPAEAMRPATPLSYRPTLIERLGIHALLPISLRMVVRHMERRPTNTLLSVLGVALATAILVVGSYAEDAIDYIFDLQFDRVQQHDVDLVLSDDTDIDAVNNARSMPGVLDAEPYRAVPVRLRVGHRTRRTGVLGLTTGDGMQRLIGFDGGEIDLPDHGIILSATLADLLRVRAGERVTVEAMEGRRPVFDATVSALIDDFSGLAAYMHMTELNRLMREPGTISGVYLRVDEAHLDGLYREVHETPRIVAVNVTDATARSFRDIIAENTSMMRGFLIGFSAIIAFGVIYNSARISLSERRRDLATLRVIGFTTREVGAMQLGELAIVTAIGLPVGLLLGYGLARLTSAATESELLRLPFVIHANTFGLATVVIILSSVVSGVVIARRVRRLDLMSVLKAHE